MCCSLLCKQFFLLLWKNFILQIRRPIGTVFELILPVVAVIFIVGLRISGLFPANNVIFTTFEPDHLTVPDSPPPLFQYSVFYTPPEAAGIVERAVSLMGLNPFAVSVEGFESEEFMVGNLTALEQGGVGGCFIHGAGIVFNNLGSNVDYTIRLRHEVGQSNSWQTDEAGPTFELPGSRINPNFYLTEGFLHLQNVIGQAIIENKTGLTLDMDVSVEQFPYPPYKRDLFLQTISGFLPLLLVMAYLFSAGILVKELVLEKEARIRETMLMMGLKQWILWSTWYLKQFLFLLITIVIITILVRAGGVFRASNILLIFIYFVLFVCSMISFGFLVSVWFDSSRIGLIVGFVAWFGNYLPYLFLQPRYQDLSLGAKVASCILSNTGMGLGIEVMSRLEQRLVGLQFSNLFQPLSADDPFHMGWVMGMLIIDSVVYMLLAWYINGVKPGTYGVPKPFYFPFLPSYWTSRPRRSKKDEDMGLVQEMGVNDPSAHEEVPGNLDCGITIKNLTKIYDQSLLSKLFSNKKENRRVKAVDSLSLKMYKGQITALLGHNGAGKTTTMSILTGLYTPTGGTATINGYDILNDMDQVRRSLGICPQHNILFDRLTVAEHLAFFLRLKGIFNRQRVKKEVETMIEDLQLVDKAKVQSSNLSGGMKRKLSVAIALIGGSEIVILDEPTSGMDPYARRATWDLLSKYKEGRTTLLTTHFMDEADLLGDRIAIMAEGILRCSGSSLFLKSRYGVGYHLTLVKDQSCVSSRVEQLVKSFVPEAEQVTDVGAELSYILPSSSTPSFPDLFDRLEADKAALGIQSFGVSVTTMEEVFMKVGEGTDETLDDRLRRGGTLSPTTLSPSHLSPQRETTEKGTVVGVADGDGSEVQVAQIDFSKEEGGDSPLPGQVPREDNGEEVETAFKQDSRGRIEEDRIQLQEEISLNYQYNPNKGLALWFQQFFAMFLKRFHNFRRFYGAIVTQLILPLVFVLFSMLVAVTQPSNSRDDPIRSIRLNNSALDNNNLTLFTIQFGDLSLSDVNTFNFDGLNFLELGATNQLDYTDSVNELKDEVSNNLPSRTEDCCNYTHQILDQRCAATPYQQLMTTCNDNSTFGYNNLDQRCLNCCNSIITGNTLRSCSNPLFLNYPQPQRSEICPSPPKLSYSAASAAQPQGLLESDNVYISELLIRKAIEVTPDVFFRRFQVGFSLSKHEPSHSVCGCTQPSDICSGTPYISALTTTGPNMNTNTSRYSFNQSCALSWSLFNFLSRTNVTRCPLIWTNITSNPSCTNLDFSTAGSELQCNDTSSLLDGYTVDGLASDVLRLGACDQLAQCGSIRSSHGRACSIAEHTVASLYPNQPTEIAATVWYNNQPYHMPPAALNTFHNALLQSLAPNQDFSISVNNHPLPRNLTVQTQDAVGDPTGFGIGVLVVFGFSFLLASFVLFLVKEKESKAKHIQYVSGVRTSTYWLSTFAWDLLNTLGPIIVSIILFAAFQVDAYSTVDALGAIFLLLLLTSWASIPITYLFSFGFSNSLAAYSLLMVFFFFSSMLLLTVVFVVSITENDSSNASDVLHYIFLIFPTYGLAAGFNDLFINQNIKSVCEIPKDRAFCDASGFNFVNNPLDVKRPGIGLNFIYMFIEGILFFFLTVLIQERFFIPKIRGLLNGGRNSYIPSAEPLLAGEDDDVHAEKKRVLSGSTNDKDVVIIKNLIKIYSGRLSGCTWKEAKPAVRGISLAIPAGECFGLLGVNGAGKTTTFNILTGDLPMTSGTAVIAGYDIRTNLRDVQQRIGYCPQFDALLERLTGRELLTMFARLRGVPERQIREVVEIEVTRLDLKKHAHKKCGTYSGGNKRKLSTAIALVGNPSIVLLDEPTTGMDPTTRRYLWDVLTGIVQEGRSIVLTSHSMEECEALCTRLAIMVNGSFKCLGSIQHLKTKFGSGLSLQAKVKLSPPTEGSRLIRSGSMRQSIRRMLSGSGHHRPHTPTVNKTGAPDEVIVNPTAPAPAPPSATTVTSPARSIFDPYDTTSLHVFIRDAFPGAVLLEEHQGAVTYRLPTNAMSWSSVFRQLESNKERLGIVDYSVSQTTLEQVFINFAKEQFEE